MRSQREERMDEDAGTELRIICEMLLDSWHADEYHISPGHRRWRAPLVDHDEGSGTADARGRVYDNPILRRHELNIFLT